jgi:hypothetical protein
VLLLLIPKVQYISSLALMEAASFYSGVQNKRYSVQQEIYRQKLRQLFALKKKSKKVVKKRFEKYYGVFLCYLSLGSELVQNKVECSTFFKDKGLLRFHRVFPSAFRDNFQ